MLQNRSFKCPWQPSPVLLPGKSHRLRSLVGDSPWGRKESDTTEWLHFHFHFHQKRSKSELLVHSARELMLKIMWILSLPRMRCLLLPCFTPFVNKTFPRKLLKKKNNQKKTLSWWDPEFCFLCFILVLINWTASLNILVGLLEGLLLSFKAFKVLESWDE